MATYISHEEESLLAQKGKATSEQLSESQLTVHDFLEENLYPDQELFDLEQAELLLAEGVEQGTDFSAFAESSAYMEQLIADTEPQSAELLFADSLDLQEDFLAD